MDAVTPIFQATNKGEPPAMKGARLNQFDVYTEDHTVFYKPRKLLFAMEFDQPRPRVSQIRVRLVHSCEAKSLPPVAKLRTLALEALQAWALENLDAWEDGPQSDEEKREAKKWADSSFGASRVA